MFSKKCRHIWIIKRTEDEAPRIDLDEFTDLEVGRTHAAAFIDGMQPHLIVTSKCNVCGTEKVERL